MSDSTTSGVVDTLKDQLDKPPDDSKKFKVIMRGLYAVVFVFLLGCVMVFLKPDIATQITSFGQAVCLSIGGLAGIGAGSIAMVDFKNSGSLAQVVQATINK